MALAAGALVATAFGCGSGGLPDKVKFAAPPQAMLQGGVSVALKLVHAEEDEMTARFIVTNMSNQPMFINRDGWALRLPSGAVLPRVGGMHDVYNIAPGQSHDVHVNFTQKGFDMRTLQQGSVIVGGITYANDPMPRVVGEIPISFAGSADDD